MKSISGKRMCRVLERKGWELVRVRGSYHIYEKPGHPDVIVVPVHANRDLKSGTQRVIMKDAELEEREL